jgi:hypothetical protein
MQCLEKNPNKRPQTARELSDALSALHFEHPWTDERAELWWKQNRPEEQRATSALDEKERASVRSEIAAQSEAPAAKPSDPSQDPDAPAKAENTAPEV